MAIIISSSDLASKSGAVLCHAWLLLGSSPGVDAICGLSLLLVLFLLSSYSGFFLS